MRRFARASELLRRLPTSESEGIVYCRTKRVRRGEKTYEYLQLVECKRVNGNPVQQYVESLGRIERERGRGVALQAADALLRFFEKRYGPEIHAELGTEPTAEHGRELGALAVIESAWKALRLDRVLERLAKGRRFEFSLERAVFAMVAHRLVEPGSKLACAEWLREDACLPSVGALDDDDLYASLTWLEEVMPDVEKGLFKSLERQGKLKPTAVFYDTTTTWFEGRGPEELAQYGRPKGGQPLYRRIVLLGLARSAEGWPITHQVFPGDTADVATVERMLLDLKGRFGIQRFVFVGDRGMISAKVVELLERLKLEYVLATRMRSTNQVRDAVLSRAGRFQQVQDNLEVKEVWADEVRFVVCRNPASIERDRKRRDDILDRLRKQLAKGDKADTVHGRRLLGHRAYRRYLVTRDGKLAIAQEKVKRDERYDGKWVLRSNIEEATAADLARIYREQIRIERDFRDLKSVVELRPIRHRTEPRVRAHVFLCVLALAVRNELKQRLAGAGSKLSLDKAFKKLRRLRARPVPLSNGQAWLREGLTPELTQLLDGLGVTRAQLPRIIRVDV